MATMTTNEFWKSLGTSEEAMRLKTMDFFFGGFTSKQAREFALAHSKTEQEKEDLKKVFAMHPEKPMQTPFGTIY